MRNQGNEEAIAAGRKFMKSNFNSIPGKTDQGKNMPVPSVCITPKAADYTKLSRDFDGIIKQPDYISLLKQRRSVRAFKNKPLTLQQLSFLLWSTQGIDKVHEKSGATRRPVPSGGARHPFETYITVKNVQGLKPGLYHYLPLEHSIEFLRDMPDYDNELTCAMNGQSFTTLAPIVLVWACVPYRGEWRYSLAAHHTMMLDLGHVGQNAYLSAEALGLCTCAIGAFEQAECDKMLGVDGEDEFSVYAAPVGEASIIAKVFT